MSFDGQGLSFTTSLTEVWKSWCSQQASYDWGPHIPGVCGCAPDWGINGIQGADYVIVNPTTGAQLLVRGSTSVFGGCNEPGNDGPPCVCASSGCTVDMSGSDGVAQLTLTPGHLDGTFAASSAQTGMTSTLPLHLTLP